MQNSKLIGVLKTFDNDEIKSFKEFVYSPFFNKEKVLIKMSDFLYKNYPDFDSKKIEKRKVFSYLYPGKIYNDSLMRNIISDLLGLAEKFLAVKNLNKDILLESNLLLKELTSRNLDALFEKNLRKAKNLFNDLPARDENYYYYKYILEDKKRRWMQLKPGGVIYSDDNIQNIADDFLLYFLIEHLKNLSIMVNQKKYIYDHKFNFVFMEEIDSYLLRNPDTLKIPYIELFYKSLKLFLTESENYYYELRSLVKKHYNILNEVDKKNMYVVLINYCSEKINKGELKYFAEKFELYKEIIETGAHYEGKPTMSHIFYKGVVSNALEIGEFTWTEKFITEYKDKLDTNYSDSCFNYCLAHIKYKMKEYDNSLECLSRVSKLDVSFKLDVNVLQMMIYYDTDSEEPFYSLIDSFSHLLAKNKLISSRRKELHTNFVNFTKELFRIKTDTHNEKSFDINEITKRIEKNNYLIGKPWLLQKVKELEN